MIEYVVIRDTDRKQIGIIDAFDSVIWKREYYGAGKFEIYCQATAEAVELLKVDNFVTRNDDDEVGIIENIRHTFNLRNGWMIRASGRFAKSILDRRIIYRLSGTQNAPTILQGNVETAVRRVVNANIISATDSRRNIPFLRLGAVNGITSTIVDENGTAAKKQTTFGGLLDYTDEVLKEYELGSRVTLEADTKNLLYQVFGGKDRSKGNADGNQPVIFSQTFDNLTTSEYEIDKAELKTTALIGGSGEDLERFYAMTGQSASGVNRREIFVNAASVNRKYKDDNDEQQEYTAVEYTALLTTEGKMKLKEHIVLEFFEGDVEVNNSQYVYKQDYDLGDVVTVQDDAMGLSMPVRLAKITEVQDASGYIISVEFSA